MCFGLCSLSGDPFYLRKVNVRGLIVENFAKIEIVQHYSNETSMTLDSMFVFPIDSEASVTGFSARYRDRNLKGTLRPKAEAKKIFDLAKKENKFTAYLEETLGDVFSIAIGRVNPGEDVELSFQYVTPLFRSGKLVIPAAVATRYAKDPHALSLSSSFANVSMSFHFPGSELLDLRTVSSPTHEILIYDNEVTLRQGRTLNTKDFVLVTPSSTASYGLVDDPGFLFLSFPVLQTSVSAKTLSSLPTEYIFLADRSGSMQDGNKMQSLRNLLVLALKSIPVELETSFNVIGFGDAFEKSCLWSQPKAYTDANVSEALQHIQAMEADLGGTEMSKPIEFAYQPLDEKKRRIVVLLTDGQIDRQDEIAHYLQVVREKSKGELQLYTIGIGDQTSRDALMKLAQAGGGDSYFTVETQDLNSIIVAIMQEAQLPRLKRVESESMKEAILIQQGGRASVWGKGKDEGSIKLKLTFTDGTQATRTVSLQIIHEKVIPVFWAKKRLQELSSEVGNKSEMEKVSLTYGILSSETAFVLVDTRTQQTIADHLEPPLQSSQESYRARTLQRATPAASQAGATAGAVTSNASAPDLFSRIVLLQKVDGSFPSGDPLIAELEGDSTVQATLRRLQEQKIYKRGNMEWGSVVVWVYLHEKLGRRQGEWNLMAAKLGQWLQKRCASCFKQI